MKTIVMTIAVSLLLFVGWQTYLTTRGHSTGESKCSNYVQSNSDCVWGGPFGWFDVGVARFYITEFVHHAVQIPLTIEDLARDQVEGARGAVRGI